MPPTETLPCASPPGTSIRSASGWTTCTAWLKEREPDIVCLQEIKCVDEAFPREPLEALGYNVAVHGQKTFNGVAMLSKLPFDEVAPGLPGDDGDVQARFLEALVSTPSRRGAGGRASICPTAIRARTKNMNTKSNGWTGLLLFHMNG